MINGDMDILFLQYAKQIIIESNTMTVGSQIYNTVGFLFTYMKMKYKSAR